MNFALLVLLPLLLGLGDSVERDLLWELLGLGEEEELVVEASVVFTPLSPCS